MYHKLRAVLFVAAFLLRIINANAQIKKPLSLSEAIKMSIKNSYQLKTDQLKIEEASAALREAIEKKLPNANASASYLRLNSANFDLKSSNNNNGGNNTGNAPNVSQAMYGILNISLPIYSGKKIQYGIASSRYLMEAIKLDADADHDAVIQNTIEAFANLYKARFTVTLITESLEKSRQRVKDFTNLEKNGLLARNDLLKAELQSSNLELNLLDAENGWQLANLNMNLMLGLPDSIQLQLDTTGIEKKEDNRTLSQYIETAQKNRKDIMALQLRKEAAETNVKAIKGEMYPSLQLTCGYIAVDVPHVFTVTNAVNIGIGASYSIASLWKTKSRIQQADARVKQLAVSQAALNDNIRLQVNKDYQNLLSNRKKIEVHNLAVTQAEENYKIVKNKFNNSLATTTDLLEADVSQLEAKLSYTLARIDAFISYNKLLQTIGTLSADFKK